MSKENWLRPRMLHFTVGPSRTEGKVIAHCLDYDLVASAETAEEALRRLDYLVQVHVETAARKGLVMALQHTAPDSAWELFRNEKRDLQVRSLEIGGLDQLDDQARTQVGVIAALIDSAKIYAIQ